MTEHEMSGDAGLDKDLPYAERFWQRQPEGMREVMTEIVHDSASTDGFIYSFINMNGLDDQDREKLSAYRVLARELGYEVGQYVANFSEGTAMAPIRRIPDGGK